MAASTKQRCAPPNGSASAEVALAKARIAANRKASNARALLEAVPRELHGDPGYIFSKIQLLRREEKFAEAAQLMLSAPKDPARLYNLDEWWIERRLLSRKMLDIGEHRTAYLIARDAALPARDIYKTEQEFTAGWIALRFLKDPGDRRAALCADRRRQRQSDRAGARRLLAGPRRGSGGPRPGGPRRLHGGGGAIDQLLRPAGARQARTAADRAERRSGGPGPRHRTAGNRARGAAALRTGRARNRDPDLRRHGRKRRSRRAGRASANWPSRNGDARGMLLVGKAALNRGLPFDFYAYPVNGIPPFRSIGPEVEQSVIFAIARQESAFNPAVVSPAQAYGLMQVTPDAGRYVCKKYGASFDLGRMKTDPVYNAALGAAELGGLIEDYRGSYIMTFAAYNAGRGSVKKWIERYGDPRDPKVDAVDWVELIPFSETRNYVQRIMENLQVYRARFGGGTRLQIEADLHRGAASNSAAVGRSSRGKQSRLPAERPSQPDGGRLDEPPAQPGDRCGDHNRRKRGADDGQGQRHSPGVEHQGIDGVPGHTDAEQVQQIEAV